MGERGTERSLIRDVLVLVRFARGLAGECIWIRQAFCRQEDREMKQPHGLALCLSECFRGGIHHQLSSGCEIGSRIAALRGGRRGRGFRENGLTADERIACQ